ncbi:MAG: siderophore-interacting protein [Sphingomonas bacterium]
MLKRILPLIERVALARISECTALRVVEARRVTPHMQRVTFSGTDIGSFATDANLHVRLLLPPPGAARDGWLKLRRDGKASVRDRNCKPVVRKYTIRAIDPASGRIAIDFVLHEDGGPGGSWAAQARAGDLAGILGPGGRGLSPADWYLIAGDETALPAIGRMMDAMPAHAQGHVIIEIADALEEQPLPVPPGMTLRWLHRNGAAPGTTGLLLEAIRAVRWPSGDGKPFAWVGAEFTAIQAIRDHLARDRGLAKADQLVVAYWRHQPRDSDDAPGEAGDEPIA